MPSSSSVPKPLTRVALVEDQPEIRENWRSLIDSFPGFKCVRTCVSGEEALHAIPAERPDVVLMDIFLPRMSGIECVRQLKEVVPEVQFVMLTVVDDDEVVFKALEAGADGYLLKLTKPEDLRASLLDVLNGGAPMSSGIARCVIRRFRQKPKSQAEQVRLSTREEEVLIRLSKGYSNKEIAEQLDLRLETVRSYLKLIYKKLQVRSRTEAVVRYLGSTPPSAPPA